MPDYEKLKLEVLPSAKPLTQPVKPLFYADLLVHKSGKKEDKERQSISSPPQFKF